MGNLIIKKIQMLKSLFSNPRGYSLIEVTIALGVFAIGALSVSQLLVLSLQNNKTGNEITQATLLAETKMEGLKGIEDVTTLTSEVESRIDQYGQPGGIFTRTCNISNPLGGDFSRQIRVTVRWFTKSRMRRVMLTSWTQGNGI